MRSGTFGSVRASSRKLLDHLRSNAVAYLALFVALGGTGAWAADKITSKEIVKNAVRSKQIKENAVKTPEIANRAVTADKLADGVEGLQGPEGPAGQDATNLFAYVNDNGGAGTASIVYGSGVTAVRDPAGSGGNYLLTFSRSLVNCVVQASLGYGDPFGGGPGETNLFAFVAVDNGGPDQAEVFFENAAGTDTDTSFMVTAFC